MAVLTRPKLLILVSYVALDSVLLATYMIFSREALRGYSFRLQTISSCPVLSDIVGRGCTNSGLQVD